MAPNNSISRALLRPGHFLILHIDRLLYVLPRPKSGRIFCFSVLPNWQPQDGS